MTCKPRGRGFLPCHLQWRCNLQNASVCDLVAFASWRLCDLKRCDLGAPKERGQCDLGNCVPKRSVSSCDLRFRAAIQSYHWGQGCGLGKCVANMLRFCVCVWKATELLKPVFQVMSRDVELELPKSKTMSEKSNEANPLFPEGNSRQCNSLKRNLEGGWGSACDRLEKSNFCSERKAV